LLSLSNLQMKKPPEGGGEIDSQSQRWPWVEFLAAADQAARSQ
jgi:hypothetical protein